MKTKIIFFLAISAVVTLSFTFASIKSDKKVKAEQMTKTISNEPIGGFASDDKI